MVRPESLRKKIFELERLSEKNTGLNFIIALNYGGHDEILRAIKKICDKVIRKEIFVDDIDEMIFKKFLDTKEKISAAKAIVGNNCNEFTWNSILQKCHLLNV